MPAPLTPGGPEQAAQQKAAQTGQPVVVDELTTETDQTIAEPDGSFSVRSYIKPVRVHKNDGWTPLDATLTQNVDGTFSTAATPNGVTLSGGGSGPLATLTDHDGHLLSYRFPVDLPVPDVTADTALYRDVLPGVDLQASVTDQGGFREVLIVNDATAAANPILRTLKLSTVAQGLTLSADDAGNLDATTADGSLAYASPTPLMWDSSTQNSSASTGTPARAGTRTATVEDTGTDSVSSADGPGPGAQVQPVDVAAGPDAVTLTPDAGLLTGQSTTYPVFIDPYTNPTSSHTSHYTEVAEGCPNAQLYDDPQDNGEGVGYQQYASNCFGLERSYYTLNTSSLDSKMVISSATLYLTETYGADHGCSNTWPVTLKETDTIGGSTDWNHQPGVHSTIGTKDVKSAASGCGNQDLNFDVTNQMKAIAKNDTNTWTFGLIGDEDKTSTNYGFMRFSTNPQVITKFDVPPNAPTDLSTTPDTMNPSGPACVTHNPGWIGRTSNNGANSNINFDATVSTQMQNFNVRARFMVTDAQTADSSGDPTTTTTPYTGYVSSGGTVHANIGFQVKDGHRYLWAAQANDGTLSGPWVSNCQFNVDLTPPTPAKFTDSVAFPPLGSSTAPTKHAGDTNLTIQVTSTDPTPTGCTIGTCLKSGIRRFEYSMDKPIPPTGAASISVTPDSSGKATANIPISVTAQQWGTHTLYVQAVDGAENARPATYAFYAPWNPSTPVLPGDVNGDGVPDLITPAADGNLYMTRGNTDTAAAPELISSAAQSPDHSSWNNFQITHRGSTNQSGVDDLFALRTSTTDRVMYVYHNDADIPGGGQPGHFTSPNGLTTIPTPPPCNPASDCTGYDQSWNSVGQILAPGGATGPSSPPSLITVTGTSGLWFYPGSSSGDYHLGNAVRLGTGNWSHMTLVAPGTVGGAPTLWARDDDTGVLHTYPLSFDSNGLPTSLLTRPADRPLVSGVAGADGGTLCADVTSSDTTKGTAIQMFGCNQTTAQRWTIGADKSVRALGNCLDATQSGTANGTPIQLYPCNQTAAQEWTPGPGGTLKNAGSGRCLTDPSGSTAPGTQLVLWDCGSSAAYQNWGAGTAGSLETPEALLPLNFTKAVYPTITSPGDVNSASSTGSSVNPDSNPDLYVINNRGRVIEFPGAAPTSGTAQFAGSVGLGYLTKPAPADTAGDLNGDGIADLLAIDNTGHLRFYPGRNSGRPENGPTIGSGWADADISHHGDWTGDGYEDLIAHLPNDNTHLWLYPGDGTGDFGTRHQLNRPAGSPSSDWSKTTAVISAGDVNLDAYPDVLAVENDLLYLFPGTASGQLASPKVIGTSGWAGLQLLAPGDVNGDGLADLWTRNPSTGVVNQYVNDPADPQGPGYPLGRGSSRIAIGSGFNSATPGVAASGDGNGDGHPDLWATWTADDHLHFYAGTGYGAAPRSFDASEDASGGGWTTVIDSIA
ncbi:ricin-type beta-trefoil lectin domain protein [Actinacidiphila alni]|uniref:ricin-type beta-trefoil lectin domain protein n=1 Tax=Actinacidiphila alni TaxID=380248 RepID=UPI0015A53FDB|nr:ricin-type beta-trefoil lectin domain protein [Actinacidiphila alni]